MDFLKIDRKFIHSDIWILCTNYKEIFWIFNMHMFSFPSNFKWVSFIQGADDSIGNF